MHKSTQFLQKTYEELPNPHPVPVPETRKKLVLEILERKRSNMKSLNSLYKRKYEESPLSIPKHENNESSDRFLKTSDTLSQHRTNSQKRPPSGSPQKVPKFKLKDLGKALNAIPRYPVPKDKDKFPLSPDEVLQHYSSSLSTWEQAEVLDYPKVYFIGKATGQKTLDFDTDQGYYKIITNDHIGFRYEIVNSIGKGAFGEVIQVFDHCDKKTVAIKIVKNQLKISAQARTEINILNHINSIDRSNKSNIIDLISYFEFRKHIVITT
jgi:dual specificity tyrosine-phosphorylation-regulated kinase 2/3/4